MASSDDETVRLEVEVLRDLMGAENSGSHVTMEIGPFTAYMIVGLCQLGVKSLPAGDGRAEIFKRISADFEPFFSKSAAAALIDTSWNDLRAQGK
jgi:hypothetical protein